MSLKQRVPLTFDAQGKPLFINIEWLKDLQAATGDGSTNGNVTQAQFDVLQATVNGQQALIEALTAALAALTSELEDGYQS